eukprot:scaffold33852_cov54-Phaeocystis_antarctica.AAC.1
MAEGVAAPSPPPKPLRKALGVAKPLADIVPGSASQPSCAASLVATPPPPPPPSGASLGSAEGSAAWTPPPPPA